MVKVGLTYDLRNDYLALGYSEEETAEFDRDDTIYAIEGALNAAGYGTDRIGHVRSLLGRLLAGDRWDVVFNIAEGLSGYGREALIPALLDAFTIPYTFSDALVLALSLHKGMTKHVIRDLGIPTADFTIVETDDDVDRLDLPFPLFAKPVAEGTSKGITASSIVSTREELRGCCGLLAARFRQPVLVETFLPGREFTVGIIGTGRNAMAVGAMEVHLRAHAEAGVYSYLNKERYEELVTYRLAEDETAKQAKEIALAAWRGLGCRDAGRIDLRADASGTLNFLEVNPLAGLHPAHSDLPIICSLAGISYQELIDKIMISAMERIERAA